MYVYEVEIEGELYHVSDPYTIIDSFGKDITVTRYVLTDAKDISDEVLGDYYIEP